MHIYLLEERCRALEELQRRCKPDKTPLVCRVCYCVRDHAGCLCGRSDWTMLAAVLSELSLRIDESRRASLTEQAQVQLLDA